VVNKRDDLKAMRAVLTRRVSRRHHQDRTSFRILARKEDNTLGDLEDPPWDAHRTSVVRSGHRRDLATFCKIDSVQYLLNGKNEMTLVCNILFYNRGVALRSCAK
jgi:hypothetical protein